MFQCTNPPAITVVLVLMLSQIAGAAEPPLRVMTFNIRYGSERESTDANAWIDRDGKHRRDLVLRTIDEADPDLLGVQEARAHQVADIAKAMPSHEHYTVGRDDGEAAGEHCTIYYRRERFDKVDEGTFWLCEPSDQPGKIFPGAACPRIVSWVLLEEKTQSHRRFVFLNTHWDHVSQPAREFAAGAIVARLKEFKEPMPLVVVGDMNAVESSPEIKRLHGSEEVQLLDAYRATHPEVEENESTLNGFKNRVNGRRIDYVLHSPAWSTRSATIVRDTFDGRNASDHFAVVVELDWAGEDESPMPSVEESGATREGQ